MHSPPFLFPFSLNVAFTLWLISNKHNVIKMRMWDFQGQFINETLQPQPLSWITHLVHSWSPYLQNTQVASQWGSGHKPSPRASQPELARQVSEASWKLILQAPESLWATASLRETSRQNQLVKLVPDSWSKKPWKIINIYCFKLLNLELYIII